MDTRIAVAVAFGALAIHLAYQNPALGAAIGVGAVVVTLLHELLR